MSTPRSSQSGQILIQQWFQSEHVANRSTQVAEAGGEELLKTKRLSALERLVIEGDLLRYRQVLKKRAL
jgi:hypothetical protein